MFRSKLLDQRIPIIPILSTVRSPFQGYAWLAAPTMRISTQNPPVRTWKPLEGRQCLSHLSKTDSIADKSCLPILCDGGHEIEPKSCALSLPWSTDKHTNKKTTQNMLISLDRDKSEQEEHHLKAESRIKRLTSNFTYQHIAYSLSSLAWAAMTASICQRTQLCWGMLVTGPKSYATSRCEDQPWHPNISKRNAQEMPKGGHPWAPFLPMSSKRKAHSYGKSTSFKINQSIYIR